MAMRNDRVAEYSGGVNHSGNSPRVLATKKLSAQNNEGTSKNVAFSGSVHHCTFQDACLNKARTRDGGIKYDFSGWKEVWHKG